MPIFVITTFMIFFYELPVGCKAGSVAMYVKKSLNGKRRNDLFISFGPNYLCENLWVECNSDNDVKCLIAAMYRHPNQSICAFGDILEKELGKISKFKNLA